MSEANQRARTAATAALCPAWGKLACIGLLTLAGCATAPADHFYTLSGGTATAVQTAQPSRSAPGYFIEVAPVSVPQQVDRPQFVTSNGTDQVEILEHQRWSAPLADEIGRALSADLSARLGTIDVYRTPRPTKLPVYRITLNVQRFASNPGAYARIDAVWSVHRAPGNAVLTCRSAVSETIGPGYGDLVNGHRRAVLRIADDIAAAVDALAAGGGNASPTAQAACPAAGG